MPVQCESLFYSGIGVVITAVALAIVFAIIGKSKASRLRDKLESEYGKKPNKDKQ